MQSNFQLPISNLMFPELPRKNTVSMELRPIRDLILYQKLEYKGASLANCEPRPTEYNGASMANCGSRIIEYNRVSMANCEPRLIACIA